MQIQINIIYNSLPIISLLFPLTGSFMPTATREETKRAMREGGTALLNNGIMFIIPAHNPGIKWK